MRPLLTRFLSGARTTSPPRGFATGPFLLPHFVAERTDEENRREGCVAREGGKRASDADGIGIRAVPPGWEFVGKVGLAAAVSPGPRER
jgi:hypothetical protein